MGIDDYARLRAAIGDRRLPLAYVDLDAFERNLDAMARRASKPIRVASKSVRCAALLRRVLEHEAYEGVLCFTPAEAAALFDAGVARDLLVAYPNVEPEELRAAALAVRGGARLRSMVDDAAQVEAASRAASAQGVELELAIDLDVSLRLPGLHFGVRRSPVHDERGALDLADTIAATRHVRLTGLMGYEAQVAGLPDSTGRRAMDLAVRQLKRRSIAELHARRTRVVDALRARGAPIDLVNGGGTGSLESTCRDPSVTEVSAGSGLYAPASFDGFRGFRHEPAAGFVLPVVRRPAPRIVTCLGGGYVASGAAGPDRLPTPHLPRGLALLPAEGAGEVQTPLRVPRGMSLGVGDPVFFRHTKAGELCERFDSLLLVRGARVVDEVPTYRGEGWCFL